MDYIAGNKEAWEEAFENRDPLWGKDIVEKISTQEYPFLEEGMAATIKKYGIANKSVVQFCSNNGRELMSVVKAGAKEGVGFDIAENQVAFANSTANELDLHCRFHARNILDIDSEYAGLFDMAIITIGALCWFKDLDKFFAVVSCCMKKDGILLINEQHPVANMLGAPGDEKYIEEYPLNICNSYFSKEWIENGGMYYMTKKSYESKTFVNYTHALSEIMEAMCKNGMHIIGFKEFDYDISGMFESLNHKGVPLSYVLEAKKKEAICRT